jgi:hypothetical protein
VKGSRRGTNPNPSASASLQADCLRRAGLVANITTVAEKIVPGQTWRSLGRAPWAAIRDNSALIAVFRMLQN